MTRDALWWTLRKTATPTYIGYGETHATLFVTKLEMQKGPPVTIRLSLEQNLQGRNKNTGTYLDAQALAEGQIRRLRRVELSDEHALDGLRHHLRQTADPAPPWRLVVILRGQHEFMTKPEYRDDGRLVLQITGAA